MEYCTTFSLSWKHDAPPVVWHLDQSENKRMNVERASCKYQATGHFFPPVGVFDPHKTPSDVLESWNRSDWMAVVILLR